MCEYQGCRFGHMLQGTKEEEDIDFDVAQHMKKCPFQGNGLRRTHREEPQFSTGRTCHCCGRCGFSITRSVGPTGIDLTALGDHERLCHLAQAKWAKDDADRLAKEKRQDERRAEEKRQVDAAFAGVQAVTECVCRGICMERQVLHEGSAPPEVVGQPALVCLRCPTLWTPKLGFVCVDGYGSSCWCPLQWDDQEDRLKCTFCRPRTFDHLMMCGREYPWSTSCRCFSRSKRQLHFGSSSRHSAVKDELKRRQDNPLFRQRVPMQSASLPGELRGSVWVVQARVIGAARDAKPSQQSSLGVPRSTAPLSQHVPQQVPQQVPQPQHASQPIRAPGSLLWSQRQPAIFQPGQAVAQPQPHHVPQRTRVPGGLLGSRRQTAFQRQPAIFQPSLAVAQLQPPQQALLFTPTQLHPQQRPAAQGHGSSTHDR
jgi:hypothetical protein